MLTCRLWIEFSISFLIALICVPSANGREAKPTDQDASQNAVTSVSIDEIKVVSKKIDELVAAELADHDQRPNASIDDETFLRRIHLDIVGRIPTLNEAQDFLKSKDKHKRAKLIDELLDSRAYVSHQFNYWANILRIKTRLRGGNPGKPYIDFLKGALTSNMKYDALVRELLTASGPALARNNGATGYYLRDLGMPEDNMANTARVFLGTRLECAQCHDHPFDKWTQREFFEMVAFTGGMQTRNRGNAMNSMGSIRNQLKKTDASEKVKQLAANLVRPLTYGVNGGGTGLARLPDSYQYDDGEPNEIVTAKTLFEGEEIVHPTIPVSRNTKKKKRNNNRQRNIIRNAKDIGAREPFADWLTSPDNPRFTMVVANRLWKQTMGLGLIEPVDDITDDTVASNPELMEYLTKQMVEFDYDLKQFYRAIYNSKTYQRECSDADVSDPAKFHFPGPLLRRLTAEQLWDSFLTLAVPDLDARENPRNKVGRYGGDIYEGYEKAKSMSIDEIIAMAEDELEMRKNPKKQQKRNREKMMDASKTKYDALAEKLKSELKGLKQAQARARKQKKFQAVRVIGTKMKDIQTQLRHVPSRVGADMVRASELPSPAPAGHFLREFGQSDREQIENSNAEPAVSQVLSLMNGQIEKRIINNPRTVLMQNMVQADGIANKINVIYLSMLSRRPTRAELQIWKKVAADEGQAGATDLIWTLANTSEFMFVR